MDKLLERNAADDGQTTSSHITSFKPSLASPQGFESLAAICGFSSSHSKVRIHLKIDGPFQCGFVPIFREHTCSNFGSCVTDLVSFSRVDCRFWQGVDVQEWRGFKVLLVSPAYQY